MSDRARTDDGRGSRTDDRSGGRGRQSSPVRGAAVPTLRLTVVTYEGAPDRGTIAPPDLSGIERMETWLSFDVSALCELSAWR